MNRSRDHMTPGTLRGSKERTRMRKRIAIAAFVALSALLTLASVAAAGSEWTRYAW